MEMRNNYTVSENKYRANNVACVCTSRVHSDSSGAARRREPKDDFRNVQTFPILVSPIKVRRCYLIGRCDLMRTDDNVFFLDSAFHRRINR